ncbi:restriction endonuclease subunit S [Acinetobacter indicus]|uniref:restriction endonuclease subunit S n=1 Tax=Acinetobacter indicus TaxID=756892 RepID=UPI0025758AA3|nr:restriction endonuclease subunit S [Acinetobacter indicus]MDM1305291.1 restriction endonuclease subunit S [Acinetobacter indicus]
MAVPKLRFKEFDGDWTKSSLINLAKDKSLNNGVFNDQNKVGQGYKLINVLDMYIERDIDESRLSLLDLDLKEFERNKVKFGDIFFTRSSLVKEGIAFSNVYLGHSQDITYDGHLIKLSPDLEVTNPSFLNYALKTSKVRKQLIQGGKTATMTTIGQQEVGKTTIDFPVLDEQNKIASFLSAVDEKISQLNQKHELLSQYKQGMMQKLFSQQFRFKADDGSEFGEWEEKPLNHYLYTSKLKNKDLKFSKQEVLSVSGELGVVNQIELLGRSYAGVSVAPYSVVEHADIVYTKSPLKSNPYGIIKVNKGKAGIVSTLYAVYKCKDNIYPELIDYYFQSDLKLNHFLKPLVKKGAKNDMKVNNDHVLTGIVSFPSSLEEQTKIANFLSAIDQKIEVVAQQIEQAKTWKKGLLQQMFV